MLKERILDVLGEQQLLLPALVNTALGANDRVKYYFSLLQMAIAHAGSAPPERPDLRGERLTAGETDTALDTVIAGTEAAGPGVYRVPHAEMIAARIENAMREMLAPLVATGHAEAERFSGRLDHLLGDRWLAGGLVNAHAVAQMTRAAGDAADSLHVLVMELHKALNVLQASIASDNIDGARVYGLAGDDAKRVAAFMKGVNATRALKFDHPGLATTATRVGPRLVLQNDIGTTEAHVLVIHIEELSVSLTYTDVHLPRLMFLQSLLERWNLSWTDTRSRSDAEFAEGIYHISTGVFRAESHAELDAYLAWLGSRLVFLIDWNRARKRMRLLVPRNEAIGLLRWAADNDVGHMAFLRAGGEQAVFDALASLGKAPASFGARLDDVLGRKGAVDFLRFALRISAEMLTGGKPAGLVLDELRGELFGRFHSVQQTVLDHASEQAAISIEIASGVRDCLLMRNSADASERFARCALRAKQWERRADELVNLVRELAQHSDHAVSVRRLVEAGDDVTDALEEASFHLTLLDTGMLDRPGLDHLVELASLAVQGSQEYLKAVEAARVVQRGVPRADVQDFFESVHRIVHIEQRSDDAHRAARAALLGAATDTRGLMVLTEISRHLEAATDALMHVALTLREYMLTEVMTT